MPTNNPSGSPFGFAVPYGGKPACRAVSPFGFAVPYGGKPACRAVSPFGFAVPYGGKPACRAVSPFGFAVPYGGKPACRAVSPFGFAVPYGGKPACRAVSPVAYGGKPSCSAGSPTTNNSFKNLPQNHISRHQSSDRNSIWERLANLSKVLPVDSAKTKPNKHLNCHNVPSNQAKFPNLLGSKP